MQGRECTDALTMEGSCTWSSQPAIGNWYRAFGYPWKHLLVLPFDFWIFFADLMWVAVAQATAVVLLGWLLWCKLLVCTAHPSSALDSASRWAPSQPELYLQFMVLTQAGRRAAVHLLSLLAGLLGINLHPGQRSDLKLVSVQGQPSHAGFKV